MYRVEQNLADSGTVYWLKVLVELYIDVYIFPWSLTVYWKIDENN